MTTPRVVTLKGCPILNEDGAATEVIKPGHLVKGVTSIAKQTATTGVVPARYAQERDELGRGIDTTYGVESPNYAVGDTVKVGAYHAGCEHAAWIASGQNIAADDRLESAGDGTLAILSSGVAIARALEAVNNSAGPGDALIRVADL